VELRDRGQNLAFVPAFRSERGWEATVALCCDKRARVEMRNQGGDKSHQEYKYSKHACVFSRVETPRRLCFLGGDLNWQQVQSGH
jgi:hypothetical protein